MNPIQLLQVGKYFPPQSGGMESVLYDLVTGINPQKFQIKCLVSGIDNKNQVNFVNGVPIYRMARPFQIASTPISFSFYKKAKTLGADLVHIHLPNPLATFAFHRTEIPFVVTYHCDVVSYPFLNRLYMPYLREQLGLARAIIVSSPQLIENSPVLRDFQKKCRVIPFGINPQSFHLTPSLQLLFDQLKQKFTSKIILFVGRLVKYKGIDYLLEAMKEVDALLLVVGDGPEEATLKGLAKKLGIDQKIFFFNNFPRHDLGVFYHLADVVALPSIDEREAFGVCLIEALACGRPLVTSDIPTGVRFVNEQDQVGLRVPPKNPKALAAALNQVLLNDEFRTKLTQNTKPRFEEYFAQERMVRAHEKLYQEVLKNL